MSEVTQQDLGHCQEHGDYPIRTYELLGKTIRQTACPACVAVEDLARAEAAHREAEAAERRRWESRIGQAGIPERFRDRELRNYVAALPGQKRALLFAQRYAESFDDALRTGRSALFLGLPGTGKTHLAVGIALRVMTEGRSAVFMTVMRAIRTIKDTWRRDSDVSESEAIDALSSPDLLILDEVGVQHGTETERLLLFDLLNERYGRRRPTIMLSNLTAKEVTAYLGERIMDRIREDGGEVVVFDWLSYRGSE